MIHQGDLYWIDLDDPLGSELGYRRPHLVEVCPLTTNLHRAKAPGNVQLMEGEANFPYASIVNLSQVFTVHKSDWIDYIGTLSSRRVRDVLNGNKLVLESRNEN